MLRASPLTSPIISPLFTTEPSSINETNSTSPNRVNTLSNTGNPQIIPSSLAIREAFALESLATIDEVVISP